MLPSAVRIAAIGASTGARLTSSIAKLVVAVTPSMPSLTWMVIG